jgi:CubicO group peptidase (beta-lactamase class C family)
MRRARPAAVCLPRSFRAPALAVAAAWLLADGRPLAAQPIAARPVAARPVAARGSTTPATVAERRRQVEMGLMPNVPVAGLPGWRLADRMRLHGVPGVSVAVIRDHRIDWVGSYGLADTTAGAPVTPATLFSAGSISKLVTAVLALRLAQEGVVSLDAPVNTVLRSWRLAENERTRATPVTLRLLLGHRGGTSQSAYFGFAPRQSRYPTVVEVLSGQRIAESRPVVVNQPPGAGFGYSGGGYMVAQLALMDATGRPFEALARERLFAPLGMRSATFEQPLPAALAPRAAWAYSANAWFKGMPYVYPQQAAAGLYATPTDLARLVIEVQQAYRGRGRVLDRATARALLTPQADVSTGSYREQIGLGAFLLQRADRQGDRTRYFEHTGVNAGFVAYAVGSVVGGNGVVVMMNADGGAAELGKEIRRAVARVYGWPGFLLDPIRPVAADPSALEEIAGRYRRGPDEVVTFRRVGDHLEEVIAGGVTVGAPIPTFLVGRDSLGFTDFPGTAVVVRDAAGRVTGLRMPYGDRPIARLAPDSLLPGELLRAGRLDEAADAYRALGLGESQITYMAYELLNRRPVRPEALPAARVLLTVAEERYPRSTAVLARWGEYHLRQGDTTRARASYRAALAIDSTDAAAREALQALGAP